MTTILALALLLQPRDDLAALAASYHRRAWELVGRPTVDQIAERFNATQIKPYVPPPTPPTWIDLERRAWIGWLGNRYGFRGGCRCR